MKPTYNAIIFSNGTLNYGDEKPGRNEPCPEGNERDESCDEGVTRAIDDAVTNEHHRKENIASGHDVEIAHTNSNDILILDENLK